MAKKLLSVNRRERFGQVAKNILNEPSMSDLAYMPSPSYQLQTPMPEPAFVPQKVTFAQNDTSVYFNHKTFGSTNQIGQVVTPKEYTLLRSQKEQEEFLAQYNTLREGLQKNAVVVLPSSKLVPFDNVPRA